MTTQTTDEDYGDVVALPAIALDTTGATSDAAVEVAPDPAVSTSVMAEISNTSYGGSDDLAMFDIVFTVSCYTPGDSKTFKVVKRISVSKSKLLADATGATSQTVESQEDETPEPTVETGKPRYNLERLKALSGLK